MIRHHPDVYPLYMAIEALSAIPSVLAYPNPRLHPDKFRHGLTGMARVSGLDWILTERELEPLIAPMVSERGSTIRGLFFPLEWDLVATATTLDPIAFQVLTNSRHCTADDPCLLQHSSGTTGLQKAVMLTHRAVLDHAHCYGKAIEVSEGDRVITWLPLYHDMGLIAAFHLPLALGIPTVILDPFEWVTAPALFLQAVSRESGTLGWLPNFAYNLMASRVHDEEMDGVRLEGLRALINCSEPIRADSHEGFIKRFGRFGLRRDALATCYAMAETTFAVSQSVIGREVRRFKASRDSLAAGRAVTATDEGSARICVSSGSPIPGCTVRVIGENGEVMADGYVGEIHVQSSSLFAGYRNSAAATDAVLREGWYASGDYGFCLDGELFVIGRKKDIIILAGKNIYPEDIEDAVSEVEGVIPGRVVAFGIDDAATGTERVCVVAETAVRDVEARKLVHRAVIEAGMRVDVTIGELHLVEPRWLVKSSAGKLSRVANKGRILAQPKGVRDDL
jgi:acyl-CoA synthetase (AMP-forming)/AMP-acid ligase II